MLFILNHIHWAIVGATLIATMKTKNNYKRLIFLTLMVLALSFNRTAIMQFTSEPTKITVSPDKVLIKPVELKDIELKSRLNADEREERTSTLLDFQKSFDEVLNND